MGDADTEYTAGTRGFLSDNGRTVESRNRLGGSEFADFQYHGEFSGGPRILGAEAEPIAPTSDSHEDSRHATSAGDVYPR